MNTSTKSKKDGRVVFSVHTKAKTSKRLKRLSELTQRTRSSLTNEAIENFLNHQEWVIAEIERGLEDIKAGRVIEQAEMREWAKGLSLKK